MGSLPVIRAARLGVHIAWALYHCVKRAPCAAILFMLGVFVAGAPYTPESAYPESSINSITTFGFCASVADRAAANVVSDSAPSTPSFVATPESIVAPVAITELRV